MWQGELHPLIPPCSLEKNCSCLERFSLHDVLRAIANEFPVVGEAKGRGRQRAEPPSLGRMTVFFRGGGRERQERGKREEREKEQGGKEGQEMEREKRGGGEGKREIETDIFWF